jgi:regulator of sirC expression with transglutaminase-like and TPR domain
LASWLFGSEGFRGNADDYYDPRNSLLDDVLDRRLGIPITLSVVMLEVGRRCGLALRGVGMPGHFLVGGAPGEWFDPFDGGAALDLEGCADRFARFHPGVAFDARLLAPVGPRAIVQRMLTNLQHVYATRDPLAEVWVVRLRLRVPGLAPAARAELAATLGRLGQFGEGARELEDAADLLDDTERDRARTAARQLRSRSN